MLSFTKQDFRTLMDLNEIDLRANNICYYKDNKYEIIVLDSENIVRLMPV